MANILLKLSERLHDRIRQCAKQSGETQGKWLIDALNYVTGLQLGDGVVLPITKTVLQLPKSPDEGEGDTELAPMLCPFCSVDPDKAPHKSDCRFAQREP